MTDTSSHLWLSTSVAEWHDALAIYESVGQQQDVARLPALDMWYHTELAAAIARRAIPHITHTEMVRVTEWKMARGVWRAPNLVLVRSNDSAAVVTASTDAFARVPHPTAPISALATLAGVGPATASAVIAAYAPDEYPFFDELVAAQVPTLGKVAWTLGYYGRYATALRVRAQQLGNGWIPAMVERALWAHVGGKAGVRQGG